MTVYKQDYLTFGMKTCTNASIALSQLAGISQISSYEIEIEMRLLYITFRIYNEGTLVKKVEKGNLYDCDKERDYWIGWRNGTIEVGMGNVFGSTTQVDYYDPDPHEVNFLGFASANDTRWNLHHIQGNSSLSF